MPERMKCDCIQGIPVIGGQTELLYSRPETGGGLGERRSFLGSLKNGFARLAVIGFQHSDHVSRDTDKNALPSLLDDVEAASVIVHILPTQLENFRGTEAGLEREQTHVVKLLMPKFQVSQQSPCLIAREETQALVVHLCHLPNAAPSGQRVAAAPELGCNGVIDGGTHEAEDIVDGLGSQQLARFDANLFDGTLCGLFGLCVPGGRVQQVGLEGGEQIGVQLGNGQCMDFGFQMSAVLAVVLIDVLALTSSPLDISVHRLADGHFPLFNGVDTRRAERSQELCPFISCHFGGAFRTLPADSLPMAFALGVGVPEGVDAIRFAGTGIALGRVTEEHALELRFYVFSAGYVAHGVNVPSNANKGNVLIQNLSKMDFLDEETLINFLILYYFLCVTGLTCDRERERVAVSFAGRNISSNGKSLRLWIFCPWAKASFLGAFFSCPKRP